MFMSSEFLFYISRYKYFSRLVIRKFYDLDFVWILNLEFWFLDF